MTIAKLQNCYNTLRKQLKSGSISAEDAKEKAIVLLADALDLQKTVDANSDQAYELANLINWLDELANVETVSL
ncbi:MAG: hypothetical protein IJD48_01670 [Clostridia bacterium]|nr:hypothetical protein [Clostridia bacterium]